jgi:NAD(P)H dehydrogenase (quinone)
MIVVTGATGKLGHLIVEQLLERVPADQVGATARDPGKAADLAARGVRVRAGDFADPASLAHAFAGATQVLIVSSNAGAYGGDTLGQHRAAIAAARAAGAGRVLYTSHMGASPTSAFAPARDHAATEALLRESGLAWTALRNGFYATSAFAMIGDGLETGVIARPADGLVSWTGHADLAAAAAVIALDDSYQGPTPPLTGAEALDFAGIAAVASEVLRRPIRREVVTDDAFRARVGPMAEFFLGFYQAARAGELAAVDPTLARLLGRAPTAMRDLVAGQISA